MAVTRQVPPRQVETQGPEVPPEFHIDLGHFDLGHVDLGHVDLGHVDLGHFDLGHFDLGHFDLGHIDLGHFDLGHFDVGHFDVGHFDIGHFDLHFDTPFDDIPFEDIPFDDSGGGLRSVSPVAQRAGQAFDRLGQVLADRETAMLAYHQQTAGAANETLRRTSLSIGYLAAATSKTFVELQSRITDLEARVAALEAQAKK